jgi:hypothetical protein
MVWDIEKGRSRNESIASNIIGKKPFEANLLKSVTARKFRLSIKAEGRPAIGEFQLFSNK